ncbi:hypothetical protein K0M31_011225 [Melipona bicolor]|uniref:Uncharacterized protein n=1 Tax=Melipona bicolor TaxID=60889 RepID=A0AA40KUT7_9HYME|nr:hypothetical protein K0M31_011225 [Melipona bicolor]
MIQRIFNTGVISSRSMKSNVPFTDTDMPRKRTNASVNGSEPCKSAKSTVEKVNPATRDAVVFSARGFPRVAGSRARARVRSAGIDDTVGQSRYAKSVGQALRKIIRKRRRTSVNKEAAPSAPLIESKAGLAARNEPCSLPGEHDLTIFYGDFHRRTTPGAHTVLLASTLAELVVPLSNNYSLAGDARFCSFWLNESRKNDEKPERRATLAGEQSRGQTLSHREQPPNKSLLLTTLLTEDHDAR